MAETDRTGLRDFAERAGYRWQSFGGDSFGLMTGDPDLHCIDDHGRFVVRKVERGMTSRPKIAADHLEDIEKYLSFLVGSDVRRKEGLPPLLLGLGEIVPGTERHGVTATGTLGAVTLTWEEKGQQHRVTELGRLAAAEFSYYVQFSAECIRQSFLRPDGDPLFPAGLL